MNPFLPLTLSVTLCSLASAQHAAPSSAMRGSALALPLDAVSYDEPGDGKLWARGETYKASFGASGATYIPFLGSDAPKNMPVHFRLAQASVNGTELALDDQATWSRHGETVVLDRGAVDVHYLMDTDQMEQTFVFERMPQAGDLDLRVEVESELALESADQGFRFSGELGGVRYGSATVFDGAGRSLALESRLENGAISIRVPETFLRHAQAPLVVDPVISTYTLSPQNIYTWSGDVCFDASSQFYYHTFTAVFSQSDYDTYGAVMGTDGVERQDLGRWIDMTSDKWFDSSVANSNEANNCLVVGTRVVNDTYEVWGRLRDLPGTTQGPQFKISLPTAVDCHLPSVGGDPNTDTFNRYFVAYTRGGLSGDTLIMGQSLQSSGAFVGGSQIIDADPGTRNSYVHVSKSCGTGATSERRWNVVWRRAHEDGGNIRGAQMNSFGFLATPAFSVDSTSDDTRMPQVSPPLSAPAGSARDFLVVYGVYAGPGDSYIRGRLFKGDKYQATFDINELEAQVVGGGYQPYAQSWPTIGTDGSQFVISYSERAADDSIDIYACTLRHHASSLVATEAHVKIADTPYALYRTALATQHDAGAWDSRQLAISFEHYEYQQFSETMGALYETPRKWGVLGQSFCDGQQNATGEAASFRIFGSPDPDDNRVVLDVNGLPPFTYGQFLMSNTTQNFPLDSGVLCLGQPLKRLNSTLGNSWINGSVGYELDLNALPGGTLLQAGQTWYFQYWYRDAGSSNFSNAQAVTFE